MAKGKGDSNPQLHNSLKLIAKTSIIVLFGLILSKIFSYAYRVVIARYYGPQEYGLFSLALTIIALLTAVSSLGLNDGLLRFIALYRGKKEFSSLNFIFKFSWYLSLFAGIVVGIVLWGLSDFISLNFFHNWALSVYLKILSLAIPAANIAAVYMATLRAYEKIGFYSFVQNILSNVSKFILLIVFILFGFGSEGIIWSYLLSIFIVLLTAYLICRYKIPELFINIKTSSLDKKNLKNSILSYSWPILFIGLIGNLLYWVDSLVIGYFKTATDVGFYNAAVPIAALFAIASEVFMQLFFPLITKEHSKNNTSLILETSKQVEKWIFIINLPLLMIILLYPGVIINILFGKEYLVAETALRILAVGGFFLSLSVISTHLLSMIGKSKLMLINTFIFVVLNFLLNGLLVPRFGINGAALATAICILLSGGVFIFLAKKYTGVLPFRRKMFRILLISIISVTTLLIINNYLEINLWTLIFSGALFVAVYTLLIFLTGCLDKNDWMILQSIREKIFSRKN